MTSSTDTDRYQGESKKASRILESFITPSFRGSPGTELPADVLAKAKVRRNDSQHTLRFSYDHRLSNLTTQGLVICTVLRAGFLGSGRFGSGVVVLRRDDGTWSPPSAVGMFGGGFGGLLGVEITDFVFILNDEYAVKTFVHRGSLNLSGNVSTALGPFGRSVEVAGAASPKGAGAVFAYAKTKGLFVGVSLEGAVFIEGRGAGRKLYGPDFTAAQLLKRDFPLPPELKPLMDVLALAIFHPPAKKQIDLPRDGVVELPAGAENQTASELPA